ncbi:ArsR family transcriptional regulator [Halopseudomonas sabulinigri]|uniref:ArsR family transcriptional regulator n=1 Tax=Halopseudomonas sabulinigri TaxID=472181 RepID=A0A1H1U1U2_9GAMM|nr:metalloregulator ArsR/SmtB family transcription factor [Halopseudomonas sabulinigri]SDS66470.1 ArsR family transcriptional regulator [Halopseudomonas sabulinigri]
MTAPLTFFKCLADDTRLKILLLVEQAQELCVCDLQTALQLSQPKVSRHLAELRKCELLVDERRGRWVYYRLNPCLPGWAREVLTTVARNNPLYMAECSLHLNAAESCCETTP